MRAHLSSNSRNIEFGKPNVPSSSFPSSTYSVAEVEKAVNRQSEGQVPVHNYSLLNVINGIKVI